LGVDRCKHQRYKTLHYPWEPHVFELGVQAVAGGDLLCADPFYDRRIVEFAVALPDSQRWRGNDYRWLQRRALRRVGLARIADRYTKPEFSSASANAVEALVSSGFPQQLRVAEYGWVARDSSLQALAAPATSLPALAHITPKERWLLAALEAWVRAAWS
jgi:hypothetical protein